MSSLLRLEEFVEPDESPGADPLGVEPNDDLKIASYEEGYSAGWEDAITATNTEKTHISSDFARNLQDLSFTYHEAHGHILRALEPLLKELLSRFIPQIAHATLVPLVVEKCLALASTQSEVPIQIVISPGNREALDHLLDTNLHVSLSIVEEPSMAQGQAYLRFGQIESRIDLNDALGEAASAVDAFFHLTAEAQSHG